MNLKTFHLKIKEFRLTKIFGGDKKKKRVKKESHSSRTLLKKAAWMTPVSHGYRIVEDPIGRTPNVNDHIDSLVVRREQIEDQELCFFGIFYSSVAAYEVHQYLQSNLFNEKHKKVLAKRSKVVMRKAHMNARAIVKEKDKQPKETWKMDAASAIVIPGEKLIIACMGEYRTVICIDGKAFSATNKRHLLEFTKPHWLLNGIPCFFSRTKRRMVGHLSNNNSTTHGMKKVYAKIPSNQLHVASERIDPSTEFVILASTGVWEVMKDQEAVNLISHLGDPQEAAECLTNEAVARTSRSNISCLVIRFDHFT